MDSAPTRVLLFGLPQMMNGIIRAAADASTDIRLVATTAGRSLPQAVATARADAVIVSDDDVERVEQLLFRFPSLLVLSIVRLGANVVLYELRPHRESLGDLSAPALLSALRSARRRDADDG